MTLCKGSTPSVPNSSIILALTLGCVIALTQCKAEFTGPYTCESGYASCLDPEKNQCETDTLNDGAHCGACDTPCSVGAVCVDGRCGSAAQKLTNLANSAISTSPFLAVGGSYVYWSVAGEGSVYRIPKSGGSADTIVQNAQYCGSAAAFTADAQSVYYFSNNVAVPCTDGSGGTCNSAGVAKTTATSLATSLLWSLPSQWSNQCPLAFAVANGSVYWLSSQSSGIALYRALLNGTSSSADPIATIDRANFSGGFWVDDKRAAFAGSSDSPTTLYQVSLSNGKQATVSTTVGGQDFGINMFAADTEFAYVASGGCNCDGGSNADTRPSGRIVRYAWDGTSSQLLAEFSGAISSMTVDSTSVYWATDTTVWKVPKTGGSTLRIADNLTNGETPFLCSGGCGMQMAGYVAIAVDDTSAYIVDTLSNVKALLKVSK